MEQAISNGTEDFYVGIGKSDPYYDSVGLDEDDSLFGGIASPLPTPIYEKEVLGNLSAIVKVTDEASLSGSGAYRVIPRYNFVTGRKYKVYDPNDSTCFEVSGDTYPCYAINKNRQLFVCLRNSTTDSVTGLTADEVAEMNAGLSDTDAKFSTFNYTADPESAAEPSDFAFFDIDLSATIERDGLVTPLNGEYIWAYVCTVDANSGFYTPNYMAITNTDYSSADEKNNPSRATGGLLYGFRVHNGGVGYGETEASDSFPRVLVTARKVDGTTVTFDSADSTGDFINVYVGVDGIIDNIYIDKARIFGVELESDSDPGTFYRSALLDIVDATVRIVDADSQSGAGESAVVTPMIAPLEGFGGDNLNLLPTYFVGIKAAFVEDLDGDAITGTDTDLYKFRQLSLIRGPINLNSGDVNDDDAYADCLRYLSGVSGYTSINSGDIIFQGATTIEDALEGNHPVAVVDFYDSTTGNIYYHQNGADFVVNPLLTSAEFADGSGSVYVNTNSNVTNYTDVNTGEYHSYAQASDYTKGKNPRWANTDASVYGAGQISGNFTGTTGYSRPFVQNGDVIYVDNRAAVTRNEDQTEEVRIVIQF